jgi:hypothetical protein
VLQILPFLFKQSDDVGFAMASVSRAEFVVKFMAILQNPSKVGAFYFHALGCGNSVPLITLWNWQLRCNQISEILTAENFQSGLKGHYGTDDPQKVECRRCLCACQFLPW